MVEQGGGPVQGSAARFGAFTWNIELLLLSLIGLSAAQSLDVPLDRWLSGACVGYAAIALFANLLCVMLDSACFVEVSNATLASVVGSALAWIAAQSLGGLSIPPATTQLHDAVAWAYVCVVLFVSFGMSFAVLRPGRSLLFLEPEAAQAIVWPLALVILTVAAVGCSARQPGGVAQAGGLLLAFILLHVIVHAAAAIWPHKLEDAPVWMATGLALLLFMAACAVAGGNPGLPLAFVLVALLGPGLMALVLLAWSLAQYMGPPAAGYARLGEGEDASTAPPLPGGGGVRVAPMALDASTARLRTAAYHPYPFKDL